MKGIMSKLNELKAIVESNAINEAKIDFGSHYIVDDSKKEVISDAFKTEGDAKKEFEKSHKDNKNAKVMKGHHAVTFGYKCSPKAN